MRAAVALRDPESGALTVSGGWDKSVKVWDGVSGACTRTLKGHGDSVTSVSISRDGALVRSHDHENVAKVWDLRGGATPGSKPGDEVELERWDAAQRAQRDAQSPHAQEPGQRAEARPLSIPPRGGAAGPAAGAAAAAAAANPIGLWPDGATRPDADWRVAGGGAALGEGSNVHIVRLLAPPPRTP